LTLRAQLSPVRPAVSADNPTFFLDLEDIPATDLPAISELRTVLRDVFATVVFADSFREDRDRAHMVSVRKYSGLKLHVEALVEVLHAVSRNLQARMPMWDPFRGKVATRMEFILSPVAGMPVVLFGRAAEFEEIQALFTKPLQRLSISDVQTHGTFDREKLLRAVS